MAASPSSSFGEERREPIDLSLGDPCYEPPDQAKVAAAGAIVRGRNGYLAPGGLPVLRSKLALKLRNRNNIPATPNQVLVTVGASMGLFATIAALCQPGDGVLIPDPGFPLYRLMAETQRLQPLRYALQGASDYAPDWGSVTELAPRARVMIWNDPSNPLGTVARREWLPPLYNLLATHPHLYLISDEVYEDLIFAGVHSSPAADAGPLAERIISVFSFSKSYGMTGWRVGYVHSPGSLVDRIEKAHWGAAMSAPTIAQYAAVAALEAPLTYQEGVRAFLIRNRALALTRLHHWQLSCREPEGAFFVWVNIRSSGLDAPTFAARCAEECGVLVSPGTYFSPTADDHIRVCFAVDERALVDGLDRLGGWISDLRRGAKAKG